MKAKSVLILFLFVLINTASAQEAPFSFIMLSDPQFGMYTSDKGFARETANYEFAVAAVNRLKPGFVIILGDLVNKMSDLGETNEFLRISHKIQSSIPVYYVPGNHDVGHQPTSQTIAAYRQNIGRDYYSFRAGPVYGIVLDSTLILDPKMAEPEYQEQISWLKTELQSAKVSGAAQIIVFQHHPYFTDNVNERDQWGNIPLERRRLILDLLHASGVHYVFAGHVHKNICVRDGDIEVTAIGPVGMPFAEDGSGIRVAVITAKGLQHRYYEFGKLPDRLEIK